MSQINKPQVRLLHSLAGNPVLEEMRARGADLQALEQLSPRLSWAGAIFSGVALAQATELRKRAKESGVQAILLRASARAKERELADLIVAGPLKALQRLSESLIEAGLGDSLLVALANWQQPRRREWLCCEKHLALGEKTLIMGILNATPDSFSGDGFGGDVEEGLRRARQMAADGADILDIGGESSRPGAEPVGAEEELRRVLPLIEAIANELDVAISIDTTKAEVAEQALARGACIINDISALRHDPAMAVTAAGARAGVVLMHLLGTPRDMQQDPRYTDLMGEITAFLTEAADRALAVGLGPDRIVVDPGIGFGKTVEHNLEILRRLEELRALGYPVLVGTSRKSTIGKVTGAEPHQRLEGTAATVALAIAAGADIVRVHDVKEMAQAAKMADAILRVKHPEIKEDEYVKWGGG